MSDPARDPGDRRPGVVPPLDRAPGERYSARPERSGGPEASPGPAAGPAHGVLRALSAAGAAAVGGAVLFFALGLLDLGAGLVAAAAAIGWAVALALLWGGNGTVPGGRGSRMAVAAGLGAAAIVAGFLLNWAWSRGEGGVLDPVAYLDQRWGPLAVLDVVVAAVAGTLRAR